MHQDTDCLLYSDMDFMSASTTLDFETNKRWCTGNSSCQGFTVHEGTAFFKDQCCRNNLFHHDGRSTFIKTVN